MRQLTRFSSYAIGCRSHQQKTPAGAGVAGGNGVRGVDAEGAMQEKEDGKRAWVCEEPGPVPIS
jgi:hypothetical protein